MKKVKAKKSGLLRKISKKINGVKSAPKRTGQKAAKGVWNALRRIDGAK